MKISNEAIKTFAVRNCLLNYPQFLLPYSITYFDNTMTGFADCINTCTATCNQSIDHNKKLPANLAGKSHCDTVESIKIKLFDAVFARWQQRTVKNALYKHFNALYKYFRLSQPRDKSFTPFQVSYF